MSVSEEMLAAYVDGELEPGARAEIEAAARRDPDIESRIERYRRLRDRLRSSYAAELEEAVPDRLLAALRSSPPDAVSPLVDLRAGRAASNRGAARRTRSPGGPALAPTARAWRRYALAASVLLTVGIGLYSWRYLESGPFEVVNGARVARGALAAGLSTELSGGGASDGTVRIALSFLSKSGKYCRTFLLSEDAGLACRDAGRWRILALAKSASKEGPDSQYRTASSSIPQTVLEAAERSMAGEPLDRAGEIAARGNGWGDPPAR